MFYILKMSTGVLPIKYWCNKTDFYSAGKNTLPFRFSASEKDLPVLSDYNIKLSPESSWIA